MKGSLSGLDSTSICSQHLLTTQPQPRLWVIRHMQCCIRQGLSPVLMPLPGLAPASPYFGLRPVGRLSLPK